MRGLLVLFVCRAFAAPDFVRDVWPHLERAQCATCHQDNGVGGTTRLRFPRAGAAPDEIRTFSLQLRALVDAAQPANSLLLQKPTNRVAHAGGERIKRETGAEKALREWVDYLATQPAATAVVNAKLGPSKPVLRRLTHSQYNSTVRDLAGEESRPADAFPKEDFVNGFTNQAEGQSLSPVLTAAYGAAAERIARNAFRGGDARGLVACKPSIACRDQFIRRFGGRAFRRPLHGDEIARYTKLHASEKEFYAGAQLVVEAMLQSPQFLFHLEPEPYATASRLSYFLWDTMPDEALFDAARTGELNTAAGIEKQTRRLLRDPRARAAMDVFLAQWLRFDRLRNAIRERRTYPEFTNELVSAMIEESTRVFRSLVWDNRDFREFYSGTETFLGSELARIYDLPAPATPWDRVALAKDSGRAGILGQAYFLAVTSKPAETSPTERGLFVREHFLCQQVPPPPAGVNATLPPVTDEKPLGARERLGEHLSNPVCATCHTLVDPIGFGMEKFDAIGRFRNAEKLIVYPTFDETKTRRKTKPSEYEIAIEPRGEVRGLANSTFTSPRELGERLANEPACHRCIVKQLFRFANGRMEAAEDQAVIDRALDRFTASKFRFQELIIAIATSETFRGGTSR
jgi:mono/diheme cytochrome c family protein